ncbi:MAG TPA: ATP-binding protein [Blastocatellia bacterium]|nr:ATP-binding protein [Blastocatellia bacterium]HMX25136.1 ATP-binding protein [Blastocatellia bacterium]HNG32734.1 ATP-binding protein [Blastocatellia bacterium]
MITPIEKKLFTYLSLILFVLLVLALLVYQGVRSMKLSGNLAEYTLQVQGEVKTLTSQLNLAGELAREYFLTPDAVSVRSYAEVDESLLASYAEAKQQLSSQQTRLGALIKDNPSQLQRFADVQAHINERLSLLDSMIRARQLNEFDLLDRRLRIARLSQNKNQLFQLLGKMEEEQQRLYGEYSRNQSAQARGATIISIAGFLLAAVLLGLTKFSIHRETAKQLEGGRRLMSAEDAYFESEERFRQIAENLEAVLWIRNAQTGKLEFISPVIERLWSINAGELLKNAESWLDYVHTDDLETARMLTGQGLAAGKPDQEYRIIAPDGRQRWVRDRAFPVKDKSGKVRNIVGFMVDVTDRKRAEEIEAALLVREQQARSQAETTSRMKDEFLKVVSHELRSPLNTMLGWARMLNGRSLDQGMHNHALQVIEQSAEAQARLIEDLLDAARIAGRDLTIETGEVSLEKVIREALNKAQLAAESRGVEIHSGFGLARTDLDAATVSGDARRLEQIVWNLLINAVKFTPRGGHVGLTLALEDDWAIITVMDTGQGICAEDLPNIFTPFHQADSSDTRSVGGLGLGLSLVKYLVELHGGQISAESDGEGKGATFTVRLPLRVVSATQTEVTENVPPLSASPTGSLGFPAVLSGLNILTVDDEADARELVKMLLGKYGAVVTTASSSAEAMEFLTRSQNGNTFDLIVSDIGMPEENGYTLMRRIRQLPAPQGKILAVALTAFGRAEDRLRALQAGFQMHVPKPVEPAELMMVIAGLTGRSVKTMSE